MTRDDKHCYFMLASSWLLTVLLILSYERFRQNPNVIRALVFGTLAGIVIVVSMIWGGSSGPSTTGSPRSHGFLGRGHTP